jgi:predicted alpha/beta-fold hydrolase
MNQTITTAHADVQTQTTAAHTDAPVWLREVARALREKPFQPHPLLTSGHAQTIGAHSWPRGRTVRALRGDEARLFEVEPGVRILAHCRWQTDRRAHPTIVAVHGLEGSSESKHVVGTSDKAYRVGFNTVRVNLRTCGDTLHLTPTLYHSGLTNDLLVVIRELAERDRLPDIFLGGFSLGGNMSLKLAGDEGARLPAAVRGVFAVSPPIDLPACAEAIAWRSNWLYQYDFMRRLRRRMRHAARLHPERYDVRELSRVRTLRDFDARYTAPAGGYRDVDDYYKRASARPGLHNISRPTLIIHAQDDPFIPFDAFRDPALAANPYLVLLTPTHGGHVGFIAAHGQGTEDRFWAENRIVEFCQRVLNE